MKKTEKIELRVDLSEKERLSAIADKRGQTVSDVVREALSGELGVTRSAYPRWPGWTALSAFGLAALSLFMTLTESDDTSRVSTKIYPDTVEAQIEVAGGTDIQTDLPIEDGLKRSLKLQTRDGQEVRIEIETQLHPDGSLLDIHTTGCVLVDNSCEIIQVPSLSINPRPRVTSSARTNAVLSNDVFLKVAMYTSTLSEPS